MKTYLSAFAGFTASKYNRPIPQRCNNVRCDGKMISDDDGFSRRSLLHSIGLSIAGNISSGPAASLLRSVISSGNNSNIANAMGLVQFPCPSLANTYHIMRSGESGLEAENILSTNPLFMTNRDDALTPIGMAQVEEACNKMLALGINPSVVKYSLASKCMDTSNIVANTMMIGRNRIVPEFTFMDPRGAGFFDGKPLDIAQAALWAMDNAEAGDGGREARPPPTDDGTGNDTLHDQMIRLRQLLSILETQYSGDDILLIFPDGTSPALLSCLIAGIPLKDVHALDFEAGEVRDGVNMENTKALLKEKMSSPTYAQILAKGKEELKSLRKEYEEQDNGLWFQSSGDLVVKKEGLKPVATNEFVTRRTLGNSQKSFRSAYANAKTELDLDSMFPVTAVGAIAGMVMWRGDVDDLEKSNERVSEEVIRPKAAALAYSNSTGVAMDFEPQAVMPSTLPVAPVTLATTTIDASSSSPASFDDAPILSKEERVKVAEAAMDEYLSQDDGGGDWLASMQSIIDEE